MKLQTSITYEALATALGLDPGLDISLVEGDNIKGILRLVVDGKVPTCTVTSAGFYPSRKNPGREPDQAHISYLTRKDPS